MNSRQLNAFFRAMARAAVHYDRMEADPVYRANYEAARAAEWKEQQDRINAEKAQAAKEMKEDSEYFTSEEFRSDVIDELMSNGATKEQATNRTRDQVRLFNEARQLGMM